jgi:MYXO-CTERM domain-containing protein
VKALAPLALAASCALALAPRPAAACGAPFGNSSFLANQSIVVSHHDGVERYQFAPSFCGTAKQFGMIVPVPAALIGKPLVGDPALVRTLATVAAPEKVKSYVSCDEASGDGAGAPFRGEQDAGGVQVSDTGTVGDADYAVIKSDSTKELTDWLDANHYDYDDAARAAFASYVERGWSFVTFRISAGTEVPANGGNYCGSLRPIVLRFASADPVVPTRIVGAGGASWTIYTVAPRVLAGHDATLHFAGALTADVANPNDASDEVAREGDMLTALAISFAAPVDDLVLGAAPSQASHRDTETVTVCEGSDEDDRSGCAVGTPLQASWPVAVMALLGLVALRRRR